MRKICLRCGRDNSDNDGWTCSSCGERLGMLTKDEAEEDDDDTGWGSPLAPPPLAPPPDKAAAAPRPKTRPAAAPKSAVPQAFDDSTQTSHSFDATQVHVVDLRGAADRMGTAWTELAHRLLAMLGVLQLAEASAQLARELDSADPPGISELRRLERILQGEMVRRDPRL